MPQTFDYMGALRAGYSVKEIQQATKDIDIHNALEQWGEKFFQKQAKKREAVNSMVRASRNRASAGLTPAQTLYPAGVTRDPIGQDMQNMATAPRVPRPTGIVRAENVAPDLVSAFEQAPESSLGDATSGYLSEAPNVKLRGARGIVQGIKDAPKAAWLGLNQAASAGMQAIGDVVQEDIGILTKAAKATSGLLTLNMSPTEIPADTGSNIIQRVGRDAYAAHTQGMQELSDKYAPDSWGGAVMNAGAQAGQQLGILGTAAAIGIRNPAAMTNFSLGALGAQSGLTEYGDARAKGFDVPRSLLKAGVGGGMEVVTEVAPMGKLVNFMSAPAKKGVAAFLKDAAEYGLQDIGGELLNTMVTDVVNNKMQARPNMTPQEQADEVSRYFTSGEWKQAAATTFKQALLQSGMMMGAAKGVQHLDAKIRGEQSPLTDGVAFQPQNLPPVNPERQGRVDKLAGIMANESERTAQMRLNIANQRRSQQPAPTLPAQQVAPETVQSAAPTVAPIQQQADSAPIVPTAEAPVEPVVAPEPAVTSPEQTEEAIAPELADLLRRKTNLEKAIFAADGTEKKTATKRMKDNYAALTATITALQQQNPEQEVVSNGQQAEPETAAEPGAVATDGAGGTGGTTPAAEAGMGSAEAVPGGAVSGVDEQPGDRVSLLRPQPDVAEAPQKESPYMEKGDEKYLLTNDNVKEDGYGVGTEYETKEPNGDTVTVYRAVPNNVNDIQYGDYVTTSRKYAEDHLEMHTSNKLIENPLLVNGGKIVSKEVPKSELVVAGANELFWKKNRGEGGADTVGITQYTSPDIMALVDGKTDDQVQKTIDMVRGLNPERAGQIEAYWKSKATPAPESQAAQEPAPAAQDGRESVPPAGDATQKGAAVDSQQREAAEVTPIPAGRKEHIEKMIERHGGLDKIPPAWREQWDRINEQEAEQQGDTAQEQPWDAAAFMAEMEKEQARSDAAHERAYQLETPEVKDAQAKYENGTIDIDEFEKQLDRAAATSGPSATEKDNKNDVNSKRENEEYVDPTSMEVRFDSKLRAKAIKQSKQRGSIHLDQLHHNVESMRGKRISSIFDNSTGTITSANSDGTINVAWDDERSANNNSGSLKEFHIGKRKQPVKQWVSSVFRNDMADFKILPDTREVSKGVVAQATTPQQSEVMPNGTKETGTKGQAVPEQGRKEGLLSNQGEEAKGAPDAAPPEISDLKGFDYRPGEGDDFSITKGNLTVKATSQGNGKYQASWGSATSSPHLDKQTIVDWAENIVKESQRAEKGKGQAGSATHPPPLSPVAAHDAFLSRLDEGDATPDDLKASFASLQENRDSIKAELGKLKKDDLLKRLGRMEAYRYKNDKKEIVVNAVFRRMLSSHNLSGTIQYNPMEKGAMDAALKAKVDATTEQDIADHAEQVKAAREDTKKRMKGLVKSAKNPETWEEFQSFIRMHKDKGGIDALAPEQRKRYDELHADHNKEAASKQIDRKATVREAGAQVDSEIIETTHTKTGEPLFVVKTADRVDKDVYREWNATAKKLGGWYSSYRAGGAVPGFQFKARESAESFKQYLKGDAGAASETIKERIEERQESKKQSAADKLVALADSMEEKANATLNADRLTNTARRAAQAESTDAAARKTIALATTIRNIARAIQSGEAKHLEGISAATHVETLNSVLNRAKYANLRENGGPSWSVTDERYRMPNESDMDYAEYPYPAQHRDHIKEIGQVLRERSGAVKDGEWLMKRYAAVSGDDTSVIIFSSPADIERLEGIVVKAKKVPRLKSAVENVTERMADYKRLQKMGIPDEPTLRAALREYLQFKDEGPKADKAKQLERQLAGNKNVGIDYFPTPPAVAADLVERAGIEPGMKVLEPSGGTGNIAEEIRKAGGDVDVAEISEQMRDLLEAKGFNLVAHDFMDLDEGGYDAVVMNPPFSADIEHVRHAFDLLKPGGRLVAIVGEGSFGNQKKHTEFQEWLDEHGATVEPLPQGTFTDRTQLKTTGANARVVEMVKGGEAPEIKFSPEQHIKIAANDIESLRASDVYRVLKEAPAGHREAVKQYIVNNHAGNQRILDEVRSSIEELSAPVKQEAAPVIPEQTLIDTELLRQHYSDPTRWQYRAVPEGTWFTANRKEDAVERAAEGYDKLPPKERLTREERNAKADRERYEVMEARYGRQSIPDLEARLARLDGKIASLQKAGRREFDGNGGRRASAAVSNEGAREAGQEKMDLAFYLKELKTKEGYRPAFSKLTPSGKRGSAQAYTVHLSPSQAMSLKEIRQEVSDGEAGGRAGIYNESAPGTTQVSWGSSFPEYFQNRGLTKKQVLPILDRIIRGESVTEAQWLIAEDMLKAKRYGTLNRILNERQERRIESLSELTDDQIAEANDFADEFFSQFDGTADDTATSTGGLREDDSAGSGRDGETSGSEEGVSAPATVAIDESGWGQQVAAELQGDKKQVRFGDKKQTGRNVGLSEFMDEFTPDPQGGLFGESTTLDFTGLQQIYERLANTKLVKDAMADLKRLGMHVYAQGRTAWKPWFQGMKDSLGKLFRRFRPTMEKLWQTVNNERGSLTLRTDRTGDPRVDAVLDKIGSPDKTLADRIKDSLGNLAHKETRMREIEQGFFDRYASLRYLDKMAGITGPDDSAYISARMSTSFSDVMYAMVHHGHPIWKDGGSAVSGKGLMEIFKPVADELDVFMGWMVGERAQKLMNEGRERYFDQDEINILKGLKTPENSARWEKVRREYMQYKKQVLDFAEQAGVINPEARKIWDHEEYVPFYRVVEDKPKGPFKVKGLASQNSGIRTLKGADERLGDIFENIIRNFSHLTDAAIKNRATELAVQKAEQIGAATPAPLEWKAVKIGNQQVVDAVHEFFGETQDDIDAFVNPEEMEAFTTFFHPAKPMGKDVIHVLRDGKPQYYQVHDDLLLRSMTSINEQIWGGPAMTFMRFVKRLLTIGVTSDPTFMLRNFIRDTLHTWTISRGDFTPVISSLTGAVKAFREDDDMVQLMAAGGAFHGGFAYGNDPAAVKLMVRKLITKKGIDKSTILDTVKKVWEAYQEIGSAMENAARVQTYANVKAKTGSHLQAAFEAKDIMDFSMRGDWAAINFLVQTVPFLGARIQGLQRLGKGAMENPVAFTLKGTAIALASTLLWLHNSMRPEYQELEEWDKDTYFHFFVGKKHFRLPKPFEVGAIFGTMPERLMELTLEKQHDGGLFFERMMAILTQTFAVGLPQILSEPGQQWANKDFFTGREIVGRDLQRLLPGEQSTPYTSVTAKGLGRAVNFSPKRIEHAVKGYFGTLGMYCLGASDILVRKLWDYPSEPATKPEDWPVLSAFYRGEGPARNTKYTTEFYELLREVDQLTDTVQRLRETGEVPRAEKLIEKNLPKLAAGGILGQAQSELSKINKQMKIVHLNRSMSPDEKRAQLAELQRIKNEITRGVVGQAKDERNQ